MKVSATFEQESDRNQTGTVFIVDDDPDVRNSIRILSQSVGLPVQAFANAQDFLHEYTNDQPGCLILDVRMPGITGLELQQRLNEKGFRIPTIILTAHAELPMATQAMRAGAIDFIQKPYSPQTLLERIHEAMQADANIRRETERDVRVKGLISALSARERQVMKLLAIGRTTKEIAGELQISIKTVDNHRSSVLEKMQVDNTAQLARMVARFDFGH